MASICTLWNRDRAPEPVLPSAHREQDLAILCDADLTNEPDLRTRNGIAADLPVASLLARLFRERGIDFVADLKGAFAFVIWDARTQTLYAAVDRFGIKRLVYHAVPRLTAIASRIDGLVGAAGLNATINPRALASFLNYTVVVAPETIVENVHRILPGHIFTASGDKVVLRRYWDMQYTASNGADENALATELENTVQQSVATQLSGAKNVGAYLSGGTDSSTVVGLLSRVTGGPVPAFSIGFQEERFDELHYARVAAAKFGAKHHTLIVGPDECFNHLERILQGFDEPFGNSSAIPTYFCGRFAAENGVDTLLAGDGGDELFGGNERYAIDKIFSTYQDVPKPLRRHLIEPIVDALPSVGVFDKAQRYIRRSNIPPIERFFSYHFLCAHNWNEIFSDEALKALSHYSVLTQAREYYNHAPAHSHLDRLLYVDVKITLGDSDLPKVSCMSDLAGIRTRYPYLDENVAALSGRIPASLKVKGFKKRYLFKRAFRNVLPEEILKKQKHGFGLPISSWLHTHKGFRELSRDVLLSSNALQHTYFRRGYIENLLKVSENEPTGYYGDILWTFVALELWYANVLRGNLKAVAV